MAAPKTRWQMWSARESAFPSKYFRNSVCVAAGGNTDFMGWEVEKVRREMGMGQLMVPDTLKWENCC